MALPAGISTCTVTLGPAYSYTGEEGVISGSVTADRNVIWAATGAPVFGVNVASPVVDSASGGQVSFVVPHVDQSGFRDGSGNNITGWYYVFNGRATFSGNRVETITKRFQVLVGQTTIDLDLVPDGPVIPGVTTPSASVTSLNGQTGAVDLSDTTKPAGAALAASYARLWQPSVAVLAGDVRQAPTGETIKRTANGTTRPTYDATEAALWTLVAAAGIDPLAKPPVLGRIDIVTAAKTPITSKEIYVDATMTITGVPGVADYYGTIQIRGRGNTTWNLPKKPYKIKTPSKVSLMGMPAFDDWALLANHTDPSKINNALAFAIGAGCDGLDWTPRSQFAQVYLNGEYLGLYQLAETVKFGTGRVALSKASGTSGLSLTGAYLLEIDYRGVITDGDPGFTTTRGIPIAYDDPSGSTTQQATYIQARVQEFEDVLFGSSWQDPTTGYRAYIDLDSFIDWYLVEELASNGDSNFSSSCKLYRTRDVTGTPGRFFMGPLWDLDIAFGNVADGYESHEYDELYTRTGNNLWFQRLFTDPFFQAAVATRWTALVGRLGGINATVDALTARVAAPALEDQERWSYTADWAALATAKKAWIAERINYLTTQLVPATTAPSPVTVTVGSKTTSSVSLMWTKATTGDPAGDYLVQYRVTGQTAWTTFAHAASIRRTITVTGLSASTSYDFQVSGINSFATGTPSAVVSTTTIAAMTAITDTLRRTPETNDLGSAQTGQAWVIGEGTFNANADGTTITGNGAVRGLMTAQGPSANIDVAVTTSEARDYDGLAFRCSDPDNYWSLLVVSFDGIGLYQRIAGVDQPAVYTSAAAVTPGSRIRVVAVGSTITVYLNGSVLTTLTDQTFNQTATRVGLAGYTVSGPGFQPRFTDFHAEATA